MAKGAESRPHGDWLPNQREEEEKRSNEDLKERERREPTVLEKLAESDEKIKEVEERLKRATQSRDELKQKLDEVSVECVREKVLIEPGARSRRMKELNVEMSRITGPLDESKALLAQKEEKRKNTFILFRLFIFDAPPSIGKLKESIAVLEGKLSPLKEEMDVLNQAEQREKDDDERAERVVDHYKQLLARQSYLRGVVERTDREIEDIQDQLRLLRAQ